ncbi:hypothetical protein OOK31_02055 [Streptomyces sp. NBC_00249]|uniref:hypothetical protein n=1 Tax=Streptomyces sp. NBC_00249 TaxID=2975690 RepID=UPI00225668E3|nr:hypothetical protein [Streptomyces sp. NBC_00249]MCX5192685.1 hypothetical protein [Streptomyces sp. NBC_00249]
MSDAVTARATDPDVDTLDALCRELAEAADAVGEASRYASGLALGTRLPARALVGRGNGGARRRRAWHTLLRTLTDPAGLGWAPRGRGVARAGWLAGILAGRESLAVSTAVCGLKARIRVAGLGRPDLLADPHCAAVLRAVAEDRQAEAARAFRTLLRERGAGQAFTLLAPTFADILAWHALTDENPFNDHAGWQVATGRAVTAEPLLGLGAALRSLFSRDPGPGTVCTPGVGLLEALDTSGTLEGYLRNTALLGVADTLLVQRVTAPDGRARHVVQLGDRDAPYAAEVARVLRAVVPSGTGLALVGHRLGAVTAMDLARDREFTAVYAVTHVVATGSPADDRAPADPRTRVVPAAVPDAAAIEGTVTGTRLLPLRAADPSSWRSP